MNFNDLKKVWAPDGRDGFKLGKVIDIGSDSISIELTGSNGKVRNFVLFLLVNVFFGLVMLVR